MARCRSDDHNRLSTSRHFPVSAGVFFGLGLGGFFDGIVLHQVLQWHHMLSNWFPVNTIENLEVNTRSNHPATGFNAQHTLTAVKISKSRLQDIPELSARSTVRVHQDDPIGRGRLPLASPHS